MRISRNFMVVGCLYLLIGIGLGMYMGASGDHTLYPLHAHINLLGFVLMMIFGFAYRLFPAMASTPLASGHFWLHQIGALILLIMLLMLFTGQITEEAMFPLAPLAQLAILIGVICFALNVYRQAQ
jgi:hypothetical protein